MPQIRSLHEPRRPRPAPARRARARLGALAAAVALGALAAPAVAARIAIPGTSVELEPPEGYALAEGFYGIVHESSGASVHVAEVPGAADRVRAGLGAETLAERGIELMASAPIEAGIGKSVLLHGRRDVGGVVFDTWLLIGGDDASTAVLTAAVPEGTDAMAVEALRAAMVGATRGTPFGAAAGASPGPALGAAMPVEGPPFALGSTGGLEVARTVADAGYALSADGSFPTGSPADPQMVVTRLDRVTGGTRDLETLARQRLDAVAGLGEVRRASVESTTLAGRPAVRIVAEAVATAEDGERAAVVVHQTLATDGPHLYVARGRVAASERDRWLPEFDAIADGVELTRR